ncbi:MAG: hypothetical protein JXM70_10985 [Pirellulales bacterium]|nr:hypothetical protein [Pirellulales bacterium]
MKLLKKLWPKTVIARVMLLFAVSIVCIVGYNGASLGQSLIRWQAYIWAMSYWTSHNPDPEIPDDRKHLIFIMVDHYEHGGPKHLKRGARNNDAWCDKFQEISDKCHDNYGNRFRYTWFYPFDHHNDAIMQRLSNMALEGYGEIEMHWHLAPSSGINRENYAEKLQEAITWYQKYGAMITVDSPPKTAFAYIAGVWDLDASRPSEQSLGLTNQIQVLKEKGCYADFTFSTIGTPAQPSKVNSIYYVDDDPDLPKSYDTGIDVQVNNPTNDKLMIFQGPISITWNGALEYGAIENDPRFHPKRISKWIDANIHVHGRPEWVFVKVYSHGAQSKEIVLAHDMEWMLKCLKEECSRRGITLHFMTAREAYNVVKAAEDGKTGDPEEFRDFKIGKYRNMVTSIAAGDSDRVVKSKD